MLGAVLTITGVVMTIVHGYRGKQVVPCPQGTTFPADSTDNDCYSYPHAFAGWMGALSFLMLGLILGVAILIGVVVTQRPQPSSAE